MHTLMSYKGILKCNLNFKAIFFIYINSNYTICHKGLAIYRQIYVHAMHIQAGNYNIVSYNLNLVVILSVCDQMTCYI